MGRTAGLCVGVESAGPENSRQDRSMLFDDDSSAETNSKSEFFFFFSLLCSESDPSYATGSLRTASDVSDVFCPGNLEGDVFTFIFLVALDNDVIATAT